MAASGRLFQSLLNAVKPGLSSGLLTTGYGLLTGTPLPEAMLYGAADTLASGAAVSGVRALRPKGTRTVIENGIKRTEPIVSRLETPVNIGTSLLTSMGVSSLLNQQPLPTDLVQSQQILQQNIQRDLLNEKLSEQANQMNANRMAVRNAYSPGTMFQTQGIESTLPMSYAAREELLNSGGIDLNAIRSGMASIVGV
jgi:hypothetical protein